MKIAYAGRAGAFAEQAAAALFGHESRRQGRSGFAYALDAVRAREAKAAVVPVLNTSAGVVPGVIDLVVERGLMIAGAVWLPVRLSVLGVAGAHLDDILRAHSHPMALAQCASYLRARGIEAVAGSNTAECAKAVATAKDVRAAALASAQVASELGLVVLDADVQDAPDNATLFFAVAREGEAVLPLGKERASAWLLRASEAEARALCSRLIVCEGGRTLALVPGDVELSRAKVERALGVEVARAARYLGTFGAPPIPSAAALSRS